MQRAERRAHALTVDPKRREAMQPAHVDSLIQMTRAVHCCKAIDKRPLAKLGQSMGKGWVKITPSKLTRACALDPRGRGPIARIMVLVSVLPTGRDVARCHRESGLKASATGGSLER